MELFSLSGAFFSVFVLLFGVILSYRRHLLSILLLLELIILLVSVLVVIILQRVGIYGRVVLIVMITLGACEAALGLSLLVLMVRHYGNDHVRALTSLI